MDDAKTSQWLVWTIRSEMVRNRLTYAHLVELLGQIGVEENERNLRNKVKRGTFSATFYVHCMVALGVTTLPLNDRKLIGKLVLAPMEERITRVPAVVETEESMEELLAKVRKMMDEAERS